MDAENWLIVGGLVVGAIFGVLAQRFRFCIVAASGNLLLIRDSRQIMVFIAVWLLAIGGTQLLELSGTVAIAQSSYRNHLFDWFGAGAGGTLFGIGATFAGGCAARTLVRSMEGSLHALLVLLVFAVSAALTQFGFLEPLRLALTGMTALQLRTDAGLASVLGVPAWSVMLLVEGLLLFALYRSWRANRQLSLLIAGMVIGALVVAGWYVTGVLAQDEFDPRSPSAMTVSGPVSRFGYLLITGKIPEVSFSIFFVLGVAAGAFVSALLNKDFRIVPLQASTVGYGMVGATMMGIGSTLAYGCNIGQGLSGVSTLSLESLIATAGLFGGTVLGVKWLEFRG